MEKKEKKRNKEKKKQARTLHFKFIAIKMGKFIKLPLVMMFSEARAILNIKKRNTSYEIRMINGDRISNNVRFSHMLWHAGKK